MVHNKSVILSVGIDVGTTTTQVVFSRLAMDNGAGYFSVPKISIVDKEVVYKSQVYLTPLKTDVLIDTGALREIVAQEFLRAGYAPGDTDSGAVIITGESARKENASAVLESLSDFAGDFVVSAAGPDMESLIAGKGSGAWQYSQEHHCRVVNLDIGGGTTNAVVFDDGKTVARGCLDIGGRLIRIDQEGRIAKISPAAAVMAEAAGLSLNVGQEADERKLEAVAAQMSAVLEAWLGLGGSQSTSYPSAKVLDLSGLLSLASRIKTPGSGDFPLPEALDAISFSGGVADVIYDSGDKGGQDNQGGQSNQDKDIWRFGDMGVLLGRAVRQSRLWSGLKVLEPRETIRATVVGAGTYATTISGSTISYSQDIFPLKNIPVIKLDEELQEECFQGRPENVAARIRWVQGQLDVEGFILAMPGKKNPGYEEMERAARAICQVADEVLPSGEPLLLVIENDIAKAMGQLLGRLPGMDRRIAAIDGIHVEDGEYIDVGKPLMDGIVVPVVVKTLIFG